MVVAKYAKAITAAVIIGLGGVSVAISDDLITTQEWVTIAIAFVTALGAVWAVPNKPPS